MNALLLIDIQPDFLPGGALPVPDGDAILPIVNALQPHFDLVVATQDWHPPQHESFAVHHPGTQPLDEIDLHGLRQTLWPVHCVQGSAGAELAAALDTSRIARVFRKGTTPEIDSYSGFHDNGHRHSTGLAEYLRSQNVTAVYVAGLAADYCVYFTAKDALLEGFDTYLLEDATRPISPEGFARAKADLVQAGGHLMQSTDVPLRA
ncbi:bifunctional nicotinamidase/pyrazinamidase [Hymenobacter elongatus]|uniref:nicotinamidase n=1 Tax=Hymenobacter elongatus TaxID=877208 RepID=A0A4Z0PPD0_9BACT|nr:bifunctional nicotinamidase/pyrazinamidase [Hymenobacter elongatus]TGE18353.1 bifunctional nicotinamidase/pyrazinamidase [Hymenobacter elongatus]